MSIWGLVGLIALLGAVGGIANSAISGEFVLPRFDRKRRTWRPGWIGNVVVGSIAAVVIGGMYGTLSQVVINNGEPVLPKLTISQLIGAVVVGLGGGNILTQLSQRQAQRLAREALTDQFIATARSGRSSSRRGPTTQSGQARKG